jgi:hypothetical protein
VNASTCRGQKLRSPLRSAASSEFAAGQRWAIAPLKGAQPARELKLDRPESDALGSGRLAPMPLRHGLAVLRRQIRRPKLRRRDKLFLAAMSRMLEGVQNARPVASLHLATSEPMESARAAARNR